MGAPPPRPKLTSSPEAPLPLSASSTELAVTLLACERYRLVPASGPGPLPRHCRPLSVGTMSTVTYLGTHIAHPKVPCLTLLGKCLLKERMNQ